MMSYEFWEKQLVETMRETADREKQARRWLAVDAKAWEHPNELICTIFDAFTFDLFIEMFASKMTEEQSCACTAFSIAANHWSDTTPNWPDLEETIDSQDWIKVCEAAAAFIRAFAPSTGPA